MKIVISSVYDIQEGLANRLSAVGILSIDYPGALERDKVPGLLNQEILCCWDVEEESSIPSDQKPSERHIKEAFAFLDDLQCRSEENDVVIIHCKAGKSRSVAIALAWMAKGYGIAQAISSIHELRPDIAAPNLALIKNSRSSLSERAAGVN